VTTNRFRVVVASVLVAVVTMLAGPNASAAASHALIQGSGSSWAANAINQWVADVANQGMQVVFTANGAAQGRKDYANRSTDFGVSDIPYLGKDPTTGQADTPLGRSFAYLPIAAGGTSFPYHLVVNGTMVRNLRLSGKTLARIFTDQITSWSDPAITQDNNGNALPSIPIIPVVHSEGAGVSTMFTRYLAKQFPSIWAPCNGGIDAETEYFPLNCGKSSGNEKAQAGSDGVMNLIKSKDANGSIGIEEYSYPLLSNYPAAKLLNQAGYFTLPTQYNVAVALTKAVIDNDPTSANYLTQNLDHVYTNPDPRTYALSSYVYAIIPTATNDSRMTTAKRQTLADFLYYSICQGQAEIGPIGYSSLPINLVQAGFAQIGKLKRADPGVDLTKRNVSTCNNPTFIAGHPNVNHLAQIAPQPPACDRVGSGLCAPGQGAYNGNPSGTHTSGGGNGSGNGGTGTPGATGTGQPGSSPSPGTGSGTPRPGGGTGSATPGASAGPVGVGASGSGQTGGSTDGGFGVGTVAKSLTLPSDDQPGPPWFLTALAIGLFLSALVVPVLVSRRLPRSKPGAAP
jgi:ABC-type phosphate transport system substrate-binding protein